jgi:GGDEF domain-containing protein
VASFPRDGLAVPQVLRKADHAMYVAKAAGCGVRVHPA